MADNIVIKTPEEYLAEIEPKIAKLFGAYPNMSQTAQQDIKDFVLSAYMTGSIETRKAWEKISDGWKEMAMKYKQMYKNEVDAWE